MALKITNKTKAELMTVLDSITEERITPKVARARAKQRQAAAEEYDTSSDEEEKPLLQGSSSRDLVINMKVPQLACFIAKRNPGKSYLMRHILHVLSREDKFGCVVVFTPTKFNREWSNIVGDKNVMENYSEEWIKALLDAQAKLVKKGKASSILLIFDDGLGSINYQSQIFQKLATTSRHYKISLWFAMQQYHKTPKVIRANTDYCFILNNISESNCKAVFDEFPPCPRINGVIFNSSAR
jgi:hypothetical protein